MPDDQPSWANAIVKIIGGAAAIVAALVSFVGVVGVLFFGFATTVGAFKTAWDSVFSPARKMEVAAAPTKPPISEPAPPVAPSIAAPAPQASPSVAATTPAPAPSPTPAEGTAAGRQCFEVTGTWKREGTNEQIVDIIDQRDDCSYTARLETARYKHTMEAKLVRKNTFEVTVNRIRTDQNPNANEDGCVVVTDVIFLSPRRYYFKTRNWTPPCDMKSDSDVDGYFSKQ